MTTIVDIQEAVRALPEEEFSAFSSWFDQYEEERWDRQIERDQKSGPLRSLMEKAQNAWQGKSRQEGIGV
jgi:hypothetical protein